MIPQPTRLRFAALLLLPLLALAGCGDDQGGNAQGNTESSSEPSSGQSTTGGAQDGGSCTYTDDGMSAAKAVDPPPATPVTTKPKTVTISTSVGAIKVTLEADKAPCTVNSFLSLADQGYFDDTTCHRLTTQGIFVLQCGDPSGTGSGTPGYSFADELVDNDPRLQPCQQVQGQNVCTYPAGTLAMANSGPNTNGSQFFLVYRDSPLPPAYTPFGRMDAAGLKVVGAVAADGIGTPGMGPTDGAPKTKVTITSVK